MRLRVTLLHIAHIAAIASTGCGGSVSPSASSPDAAREAAGEDASLEGSAPEAACGGCNCGSPSVTSGDATPDQACAIAQGVVGGDGFSPVCNQFCSGLNEGGGGFFCTLPQAYVTAYQSAQHDAGGDGDAGDGGPEAGLQCPPWSGDVVVQCGYQCLGRRTEGVVEPECLATETTGSILARRAYLEAVSVHAFARLERELAAHGGPPNLLRDARRARRDELRHTAMMARLARRHGATTTLPGSPRRTAVRSLFALALENAVEGCVRETYGAVVGLVEARTSSDPQVRRAMRSIAADECRHAELSWAVSAWILPRLSAGEREAIEHAMRDAAAELAREGDARLVALLASRVWGHTTPGAPSA
jgi:hypothetical protein